MIDPVTNPVELAHINNKAAAHVVPQFENTWPSRHPSPKNVACDEGGEIIGHPFQNMLHQHGIVG